MLFFRILNLKTFHKFRLTSMCWWIKFIRNHFYKVINPILFMHFRDKQGTENNSEILCFPLVRVPSKHLLIYGHIFLLRSSFPSITVSHCSDSVKFVTHILGYSSTFCLITISAEKFSLISDNHRWQSNPLLVNLIDERLWESPHYLSAWNMYTGLCLYAIFCEISSTAPSKTDKERYTSA